MIGFCHRIHKVLGVRSSHSLQPRNGFFLARSNKISDRISLERANLVDSTLKSSSDRAVPSTERVSKISKAGINSSASFERNVQNPNTDSLDASISDT